MKNERLIADLVKDLRPVSRSRPSSVLITGWLSLSAIIVFGLIGLCFHIRSDLDALTNGWFLTNSFALLSLVLSASYIGFELSRPGHLLPRKANFLLYFSAVVLVLSIFPLFMSEPLRITFLDGIGIFRGIKCTLGLIFLGCIPGIGMHFILRKLAPLEPKTVGKMLGITLGAIGALGLNFECQFINPFHLLIYHLIPIIILGISGAWLGRRLLRW